MSEIRDCSSTAYFSIDNLTNYNENEEISQSSSSPSMEETENEILHTLEKDAMQDEIFNMENITKSLEASESSQDNTMIPELDTVPVDEESTEVKEIPVASPVTEESQLSSTVSTDDKTLISKLEEEIKEKINERDLYQRKLVETEKKLADLESTIAKTINSVDNKESSVHTVLAELKKKLAEATTQLEDRGIIMANQDKQINALNIQVSTLKEVVAITRDLLQIRNTEVKHLQAEIDDMETRIAEEREKHNTMMSKMDAAARLNSDLKKEYETQLGLFKDLRIKYDEKITLLSEEKRALESANQTAIDQAEKDTKIEI